MKAKTFRPGARLLSLQEAEREFGLPYKLLVDLAKRGELAAVQPPNVRRIFVVRADLERKLDLWSVGGDRVGLGRGAGERDPSPDVRLVEVSTGLSAQTERSWRTGREPSSSKGTRRTKRSYTTARGDEDQTVRA